MSEILKIVEGTEDGALVTFAAKEIDIVRITLLYEYELLDTGNIVLDAYASSYYARRVEILRMTVEQIRGHTRELGGIRQSTSHEQARQVMDEGMKNMKAAGQILDRVIDRFEQRILKESDKQTTH